MSKYIFCPFVQVRSNCLLQYSVWYGQSSSSSSRQFQNRGEQEGKKAYSGEVTAGAMKRIRKASDMLILKAPVRQVYNPITGLTQKFTLAFITLTITDQSSIEAKEAYKKLLQPWLLEMKRKHGLKSYIWKAEKQKRGNIHYHITTNSFIRYDHIRAAWNRLQREAGLLANYNQEHGHWNPNSTDVKAVWKQSDMGQYLAKYISKKEKGSSTEGKVWDCSTDLKKAQYFSIEETGVTAAAIDKAIQEGKAEYCSRDRVRIITPKEGSPAALLEPEQAEKFSQWLRELQQG